MPHEAENPSAAEPETTGDPGGRPRYDVFLSHNSSDKPTVELIGGKLKRLEITPWLDKWHLKAGVPWQVQLAEGLRASSCCAVFVGPHAIGAWESEELQMALVRAVDDRAFRIFLVLLPGVSERFDPTTLPPFLVTRTWVDLRAGFDEARALQPLINAIKGVAAGSGSVAQRTDVCPYRGLQTFEEEHAKFFFGRERDIQRLIEKLKTTRFLAVLGASGSGKSSLVRAGLVPALHDGALPGSEGWTFRTMRPGPHPVTALAAELLRIAAGEAMQKTVDQIMGDARSLHMAVAFALAQRTATDRVLWVIDQFEEVFTICRDEAERTGFLDNLLYAASVPDGKDLVVLTMRSDFYPKCASHPELSAFVASQQFLVSPMDDEGLRQSIEGPAWSVGLELEEGLVPTMLDDVAHQPDALPLLEHALLELWERRRGVMLTLEGYRECGGVKGAIAKRAEDIYGKFTPEEQAIARRILLRLTQLGEGTADTRRRAPWQELIVRSEDEMATEGVIRALVDARLLTIGAG